MSTAVDAATDAVRKHDIVSYQRSDGTIDNRLPPINGNCAVLRKLACAGIVFLYQVFMSGDTVL